MRGRYERVSESPLSAFTLWQYRNMAWLCLAGGVFFLLFTDATGFMAGVNVGLGAVMLAAAGMTVALIPYVRRRLDWSGQMWRDQQARVAPRIWRAVAIVTTTGALCSLAFWVGGHAFLAGLAVGCIALPALLGLGKLTGQVRAY
jgi:hypothetical protein